MKWQMKIIENINAVPGALFYQVLLQHCSNFTVSNRVATSSIGSSTHGEVFIQKMRPFLIEEKLVRFTGMSEDDILYKYRIDDVSVEILSELVPNIEDWQMPDRPELFLAYRADDSLFAEIAPWENLYTLSVSDEESSKILNGLLLPYSRVLKVG